MHAAGLAALAEREGKCGSAAATLAAGQWLLLLATAGRGARLGRPRRRLGRPGGEDGG
jgi:hypothetical protein